MTQPVIDTLQVSNVLKNTGMAPEQAEGVARVLGAELGAHVVVQKDLESGFQGVRSDLGTEIQKVRTDLGAEVQKVRTDLGAEIQKVRTDLGAEIQNVRTDLGAEIQNVRTDLGAEIRELDAKVVGIEGHGRHGPEDRSPELEADLHRRRLRPPPKRPDRRERHGILRAHPAKPAAVLPHRSAPAVTVDATGFGTNRDASHEPLTARGGAAHDHPSPETP